MGSSKSPFVRYRIRAASETSWSNAGWMKSANSISATGTRPCRAIPMASPTIRDSPLAESLIVGLAIGMALHGLVPVAEIEFADFIHPAFDQLVSEAARMRYRTNGDFELPMVVRCPWGGGSHGALYHS